MNSLKNSSIGKTFDGISNSLNSVGNMATSVGKKITVGLTAPLTALATAGIKYNAEMQTYNTRLKTLLGSAAEAQKTLDQIKKDAAATPFDVAGLTQANSLLISAGLSADDSRKTILALGDAVSASGGGNEELQRMAVNLQQVKNVGKATALDIKQFAFAGIDVYGMLSDYTGKSKKELQDMEITWDMLNGAIIKASSEGGRYFGAMEAQSQTISGKISTLKDSFSAFTGNLTSSLIPTVNKVIDFASQLLDKFNNLDSGTQQATLKIIGFAGALGPALIGFGQINKVLGTVTGKFSGFGSKLKGIPSIVGKAGSSFGNFGKQVTSGLSTIFSGGIFDKIGGTFSKGFGKISSVLSGFGSKMLVPFQVLGGKIGTLLSPVTTALSSFGGKINGVFSNITGAIGRAFPNVTAGLSKIGGAFGGAFSGIMGNVGNFASKFLPIFTKAFGISAIIGAVVAGLGMLQQNFGTQINSILQNMTEKGPQIIGNLVNGITSKIPELISLGGTLLNNFLQTIIANLPAIISGGIQIIGSLVTGIAQQLPTLIPTVLQVIMTIFNSLIANLPTIIQAGLQLLVSFIQGIVNAIPQLIAMLPQIISTIVTVLAQNLPKIVQAGGKIITSLVAGIGALLCKLGEAAGKIIQSIWNVLKELPGKALQWGKDMIQGFIDGIKNMLGNIAEAAKNVGNKIKEFLHFSRPDKGPLREYETWMPDMVKGLSKTLTKASPKLYNASKDLSEKLADGLDISSIYNKLQSAISLETGDISTKIKSKALLDESKNQPKTIQNDNGVNINNTQNFYNTTPSPYEEQKEAKQQLRRLAYGL